MNYEDLQSVNNIFDLINLPVTMKDYYNELNVINHTM